MSDRKPCATRDCDNTVGSNIGSDFCFNCMAVLTKDGRDLFDDLDKVLRLEAEFQDWCRQNGHPDPHT